jgi:hypothetical protein
MFYINYLSEEIPTISGSSMYIGFVLGIVIPIILYLFLAKYKGVIASAWFLPALLSLGLFFMDQVNVLNSFIFNHHLTSGFYYGFYCLHIPFALCHEGVITLLTKIKPDSTLYVNKILNSCWFEFVLYFVVFIIFYAIFHKRKRAKRRARRYEDDF